MLSTVALSSNSWTASTEIDDYFAERWYATELIIFQRPGVLEFNTTEKLSQPTGRSFPYNLRSYFHEPFGSGYRLNPLTMATLGYAWAATPPVTIPSLPSPEVETPRAPLGDLPPMIQPRLEPHPLLDFLQKISGFEKDLLERSYRWLADDQLRLGAEAGDIGRNSGLRVLWHGRWIQPVPTRDTPQPLLIQLGRAFGDTYQLEGTLEVTIGRYLHFHPRLWYQEPGLGLAPVAVWGDAQGNGPQAPHGTTDWQPPTNLMTRYMVLDESRTMRSEQLHYLDHPKLGIVVRIDPVEPPADVQDAFAALQAFREASAQLEEPDQ